MSHTPVWLYGKPKSYGIIKHKPIDFIVNEDLGYVLDGEGEHVLVHIRKTGCNTHFVAEQLARFAKIAIRQVSYAGMKDRHAITTQWFCLHMPGKEIPNFALCKIDGCEVIDVDRHRRKLRIGHLKGNDFSIIIRDITDKSDVEQRIQYIVQNGVPNYFGEQRFGKEGNNITQALRWASGAIKVNERNKRSFYLSASRSYLFNSIVSARITMQLDKTILLGDVMQIAGKGSWFVANQDELPLLQQRLIDKDIFITASLPGVGELGSQNSALIFEQQILQENPELFSLLIEEKLEPMRRAIMLIPQSMQHQWLGDNDVQLNFWLPSGSFATSVIRELINIGENQFSDMID